MWFRTRWVPAGGYVCILPGNITDNEEFNRALNFLNLCVPPHSLRWWSQNYLKSTMLIGCRETLVRDRARGLVGYDVALTRRRSPVRIRPGPLFWHSCFFNKRFSSRCSRGILKSQYINVKIVIIITHFIFHKLLRIFCSRVRGRNAQLMSFWNKEYKIIQNLDRFYKHMHCTGALQISTT